MSYLENISVSKDMDEIVFRLATLEDYEGVININKDVYEGLDYLPKLYHSFVQNPLRVNSVAVIKGTIVGFRSHYVVDGGESVVYQAARVLPELQDMGINTQLTQYTDEQTMRKFPHINKVYWTSTHIALVNKFVSSRSDTATLETIRPRLSFDLSPTQLTSLIESDKFIRCFNKYEADQVQSLNPAEIEQLLQRTDIQAMSTDGYWLIACEPFRALSCNASVIAHNLRPAVFVSYDNTSGRPSAISFGTAQSVKFGISYRMDFYFAAEKQDVWENLFIGHMMRQIVQSCDLPKVELSLCAFHGEGLDHSFTRELLFEEFTVSNPKVDGMDDPGHLIVMELLKPNINS